MYLSIIQEATFIFLSRRQGWLGQKTLEQNAMPADAAKHSSFLAICVLWHTSHKDWRRLVGKDARNLRLFRIYTCPTVYWEHSRQPRSNGSCQMSRVDLKLRSLWLLTFDFEVAGAPVMSTGSILFNMLLTPKRTCGWSACLWVQQVDQQNCVAWFMLHSPIRWAAATFLEHDASFLFNHVETLLSLRRKAAWCFRPGQMSVGVYRCATHPTWHRTTDQRHRAAAQVACNYQQKLPDFRFAKCCMWTSRTLALCGLSNCPCLIFIHVGGGLLQSSRSSFDNTIFSPLAKSFLLNRFIFHVPLGMHLPRKSLRLGTGSLLWEIQKPLKRPSRWIMLNMGFA